MEAPPHSAWVHRVDLVVATSPEFGCAQQNMRASAEWEASSPCADDMHMQTDSPSNMKTPVPEGRHGMEMDTSPMPMPRAPRSPWKKTRRGSEADLRFDDDYDTDLIWTSGENFKFEPTGSDRCDSPTILSGEGLSLGLLDLSGASDPHFGSDCGPDERLDTSSISPHATQISANTAAQCAEHNASHLSASPTPVLQSRKAKTLGMPSPGRILDNSGHSAGNTSLNLSQMQTAAKPTAAAVRDVRPKFNVSELNVSGSPLHPQRLFNPGMVGVEAGGGPSPTTQPLAHSVQKGQGSHSSCAATPSHPPPGSAHGLSNVGKGVMDEADDVLSTLERPARRLSAPLTFGTHSSNPSPGRMRYNPFLPRTFHGAASSGLTMGFFGEASAPLTTRSFMDDFCDLKEIGCGSFGRVFSCRRKIDLSLYAVKEINNQFRSERERERLLREIYALSTQGDNIHVVRYFNAWEQDDKLYIQTELCMGSLKDVRKRQGSLPEDTLKDILVQVATGLAFMHAHNIAHLDVKPDNIYTTERGIYKLGDLGLASCQTPRTHEDEGDKRYLSRELLQQHDNCDLFKADIFALGVTLLEMATGTPVPSEGDAYHGLREGRIDMPNHLSPDLRELLKMLLHSDPVWRPSAREILRHPLLCGLMRDESIACLRTQPRCPPEMQRTSATLMESDLEPELMVCVHNRALRAEKEAARLRAALQTAQQEAAMWRERAKVLGNGISHWSGVCSGKGTASPQ